jgi:hypothetical protein
VWSREALVRNLVSGNLWITSCKSRAAPSAECHDIWVLVIADEPCKRSNPNFWLLVIANDPRTWPESDFGSLVIANDPESWAG